MTVEPIGIVTLIFGLLVLWAGADFGIYVLAAASLLGAAAVATLPALGGASIMPVFLILPFYVAAVFASRANRVGGLASVSFPQPGFFYALIVIYSVLTAFFLPRIFSDLTQVYSIARSRAGDEVGIVTSFLAPKASNFTQSFYLVCALACFVAVAAHAAVRSEVIVKAVLVAAVLNLAFGFLDVVTYATHTSDILSPIRNANYRMLNDGAIGGLKRIVGSFPEASSYGYATLGFFAFSGELWLRGYAVRATGIIAGLSLLTLLMSTSSSAYAGLAVYLVLLYGRCLWGFFGMRGSSRGAAVVIGAPIAVVLILFAILLIPPLSNAVSSFLDATVVNKLDSQSGVERGRWNQQAFQNFLDTNTFGAGLGSVRASSFLLAILSNIGLIGLVLFVAYFGSLALAVRAATRKASYEGAITAAAGAACLILSVSAIMAGGGVDLGLPFSVFAALASSSLVRGALALGQRSTAGFGSRGATFLSPPMITGGGHP